MKKNKQTFAQRAKSIIKKYKRADWDDLEKDQLNKELSDLYKEQEDYKKSNNIGDYNNEQYDDGGLLGYLQNDYEEDPVQIKDWMTNPSAFKSPTQDLTSTSAGMLPTAGLSNYKTSVLPAIASGAITTGANLLMANRAMKNIPTLNLGRISPQDISLARERSGIQQQSDIARNIARSNIGKSARTRGEYLSNVAATNAAINRGTSSALSSLYSQEAQLNAQERANVAKTNAQLAAQEASQNFAARQQARANKEAYLSGAIQAVPEAMMNIAAIRQQDALINSLGNDYSIAQYKDPSLSWFQKITTPRRTVRKFNRG